MTSSEETLKFRYEAASNITFEGVVDSGLSREEWETMTISDQTQHLTDALFELVCIWPEGE
jgi:hypothetical protein